MSETLTALQVILNKEVSYSYDSEIVQTDYEIMEALDVLPGLRDIQPPLE